LQVGFVFMMSRLLQNFWIGNLIALMLPSVCLMAGEWSATVSPSGKVHFERNGVEVGTLAPQLYEAGWKHASMGQVATDPPDQTGTRFGSITTSSGVVVRTETQVIGQRDVTKGNGHRIEYRMTPQADVMLNQDLRWTLAKSFRVISRPVSSVV
jgi:hypothetical protein